jgi:serine/threonine protein kinase/DNA-binding SARP family transcriptional activator
MEFRVLGPLEVATDDGVLPLGGPKQRAVVAHLILRAGHAVPAAQLIDELWGEEPPETARNTLQTYVYRLRKVLGEDRLEGQSGAYVLRAEPDEIDASRFEALVRSGRARLAEDPPGALERLDEALGLWRGPAFADFPDEASLRGEIARLEELRLAATEHRVAAQLALGRHTTVVGTLEALTDRYPLRERLWASLMLALYRSGRQAEALDAYRRAREVLADELGIDPSPELQELHERILRQDPDLAAASTPALAAPATPPKAPTGPRTAPGDLAPGAVFAGYRIDSVIGRGGMSIVYLAEHLGLERNVALKVLAPQLAQDERFHDRFVRESRIAASMEHPAIVPIYEAGEAEGLLFLAMRYVPGTDLQRLIRREGTLEAERTAWIVGEVASALDAAHARGLVHRDVKPGNILVVEGEGRDGRDQVYLSDFGLTKRLEGGSGGLTQTGQFVGTVEFVAPEQIEGRTVDGRADVYSLACVAFECLTGRPPFARDAQVATLYAHLREPPPAVTVARPDLPPAIDRVLAKGLAKAATDRYATCGGFADALRRVLGPAAAESEPGARPATGPRRWWWTAAVAAAAAMLAGAVAFALADGAPIGDRGAASGSPTPSGPSPSPHRFETQDRALTPDEQRLQSYLPSALAPSCLPMAGKEAARGELASLVCTEDQLEVLYQLFPRPDLMDAAFQTQANIAGAPNGECATDHEAVGTYAVDGSPAGRVLCFVRGAYRNGSVAADASSHLVWTDERLLVLADATRSDASDLSLYGWWLGAGPSVPDPDGGPGDRKDLPPGTPRPPAEGTYLVATSDPQSHDPVTNGMLLSDTTYTFLWQGHQTENGQLSLRKPDVMVFTGQGGFCVSQQDNDPSPGVFRVVARGSTLSFRRLPGSGDCLGPQPPVGRGTWIRAPEGALAVESSSLVATMDPGGVLVRELDVTSTTRPNGEPDWSPDGERIAFEGGGEGRDLYVMDADGSDVRPLVVGPGDQGAPDWSPDGSRIAFAVDDLGDPHWRASLAIVNADGSGERSVVSFDDAYLIFPTWSPDGERLAFGLGYGSSSSAPVKLYVVNADGSNLTEVYRGRGKPPGPTFTPDGERIVFWAERDGRRTLDSIRVDGSDLRVFLDDPPHDPLTFTTSTSGPPVTYLRAGWSPNGRWIVLSRPSGFGGGIWIVPADGDVPAAGADRYLVSGTSGTSWRRAPFDG